MDYNTYIKKVINIKNLFKSKVFVTFLIIILVVIIGILGFIFYKESDSGNLKAKSNISEIKKIDKELSEE